MNRILFILIVVAVIVVWFKRQRRKNNDTATSKPAEPPAQNMYRCAQCGVYVGETEMVKAGSRFFCCAEHRDRFKT